MTERRLYIDAKHWKTHTLGTLKYGMFNCFTLELPWKANKVNVSCIPRGLYRAKKWDSPKHGKCIKIMNVCGRTHILIHIANRVSELLGCVAVGMLVKHFDNDGIPEVASSRIALEALMDALPDGEFDVEFVE